MKIKIIITTTDNKKVAEKISNTLVNENIAICVQIFNNVSSTYKWEGKVINESEFLLLAKTSFDNLDICKKYIEKLHNYEVPEIISLDSKIMNEKYKKWFLKK